MNKIILSVLMVCCLAACGKRDEAPATETKASSAPNLTQTPDVGKVEQVTVTVTGNGPTPGAAVNDALKLAIMQVNGSTVQTNSASENSFAQAIVTLDTETAEGSDSARATATLQGQSFAEQIIAQSKGVVSSFKVIKFSSPSRKGGNHSVEIEAKIAKFKAPADSGKIKIVVAPLRSEKSAFNIGGRMVPASEILGPLRQKIIDTLSQTGRFTVLDRQFEGELQNELDMISSGKTANTDFAKMGQALSADLVWIGVVNDFAYNKQVRKLQTSERELVSFSGGWSVSQRMINLATRQILQSTSLQGTAPSIAPTTMHAGFDETAIVKNMQAEIVRKAAEAILLRTFPISVVERDGNNVVLSQGGSALVENGRYLVYLQGKEIKDPQTGQSLGNMESMCCELIINRVTPNLSYGVLEHVKVALDGTQTGALQVREAVSAKPASSAKSKAENDAAAPQSKAAPKARNASERRPAPTTPEATAPAETETKKNDW